MPDIYHVKPKLWSQRVWIGPIESMAPIYARAGLIKSIYDLKYISVSQEDIDHWMEVSNFEFALEAFSTFGIRGDVWFLGDDGGPNDSEFTDQILVPPGSEWCIKHPAEVGDRVLGDSVEVVPKNFQSVFIALESVSHRAIASWQLNLTPSRLMTYLQWLIAASPASGDPERLNKAINHTKAASLDCRWMGKNFNEERFNKILEDARQNFNEAVQASGEKAKEDVKDMLRWRGPEDFSIL